MWRLNFLVLLLLFPVVTKAEVKAVSIPESRNRIIKLTDSGISPERLEMSVDDSIVFFLNSTRESLATMELDYHGKRYHCGSANMEVGEDGIAHSTRPFGPKDFASVCFHDPGEYSLKVYGLPKNPNGMTATIVVRE